MRAKKEMLAPFFNVGYRNFAVPHVLKPSWANRVSEGGSGRLNAMKSHDRSIEIGGLRKMPKRSFTTNTLAGAVLALAFTVAAQGSANRTFVSTGGNDGNSAVNCSSSATCRTFAAALSVTNSGGEIVVVNSGGYGAATISQPVVITAIGIDASITATTGNGLTIDTSGNVTIVGLNLHGGDAATDGILVTQVGFLRLYNMDIENFVSDGIEFNSSGSLAVYDSKITDCHANGLLLNNASAKAYVHNTSFDNNTTAGTNAALGNMTVADSSAHYNGIGFYSSGGTLTLQSDRAIFNTAAGLEASGASAQLYFANCLISENAKSYIIASSGTMFGSNPGTSLITPEQTHTGTLSSAIVLD